MKRYRIEIETDSEDAASAVWEAGVKLGENLILAALNPAKVKVVVTGDDIEVLYIQNEESSEEWDL